MNKYIRTKDGIYNETKVYLIADAMSGEIFVEEMIDGYTSHLEKVIKQADTIEELCDGFYLDLGEEFDDIYLRRKGKERFEFLKDLASNYIEKGKEATLYAFIKTSKGLIYVAKMNEEGDLCLI